MKGKAIYRWNVIDKHTCVTVGNYSTERGAINAANKLALVFKSPNRYAVVKR